ncbi:integration host factor subunit beta [bacterium]|nr:MAG: integration host factor subunit beta [bacterium]
MTKADLVEIVAERSGFTKTDVHVICDMLLDVIKEVMSEGHNIEIRRFGTFKLKIRRPRMARNPKTGEPVPITERVVPVFKPSNEFKNMISITPDELKDLGKF